MQQPHCPKASALVRSLWAEAVDSKEAVQVPGEMRAEERVTQRANNMTQIINLGC